ncbi:hypothetical protein Tco_1577780 [Tanacetum coccineum]
MNEISHPYQKQKGFYKGVLNLGPEYVRDAKMEEWLTSGHISVHEMDLAARKEIDNVDTTKDSRPIRRIQNLLYAVSKCSDNQYALSIKEDTAYLCLHFTKDHEGNKTNTAYPKEAIRRIQDIKCEDSRRYQTWSLLQEIPNMPYRRPLIRHALLPSVDLIACVLVFEMVLSPQICAVLFD